MKKQRIGFIGLGWMGKYMALNLLKDNYRVVGFNRSKKVLSELEKKGMKVANNPKEVAEESDIIILMLPTHKETKQVISGKDGLEKGLKKGHIVIDMSTSNPVETKKFHQVLKKKGVTMMDAPVSRGQRAAVEGDLSIMVGGDKKAFKKCLPIFKSMGNYITYLGPFGSGMYVKSLNNFLYAMNMLASSQGMAILKKNKVDLKKAAKVILESSGNNDAIGVSIRNRIGQEHPSINFFLKYMAKDMGIFNEVVRDQGAQHVLAKPVLNYFKSMAKKYGDEDAMYVYEHHVIKGKKN
jgi:3-hydroxyisobutyrate dehydrogenase